MFSNSFPDRAVVSEMIARILDEIEAVHFRARQPFTFTSAPANPVHEVPDEAESLLTKPFARSGNDGGIAERPQLDSGRRA